MNIPVQELSRAAAASAASGQPLAGATGAVLLANFLCAATARAQTMETAAPLIEADRIVVGVCVGLALGAAAALIFIGASFLFHMAHSLDACLSWRTAGPSGNPEPRGETLDLALDSRSLAHASVGNDAQELASGCAGAERASKDLARVAVRVAIRDRMSDAGRAALMR